MQAIDLSIFEPDGFFASVYHIDTWLPFYDQITIPLLALTTITIYVTTLLGIFLFSRSLANLYHDDGQIVGGIALFVLLLLNFNYENINDMDFQNILSFNSYGFQNLFLSLVIGAAVAYSYHALIKLNRWLLPKRLQQLTRPTPIDRSLSAIIPVSIILLIAGIFSYLINLTSFGNINDLLYQLFSISLTAPKTYGAVILVSLWHNLLTFIGSPGPLNYLAQNINNAAGVANLNHALTTKNIFNVPYPVTLHTLYDTYGNFGGSGMSLALILVLLIVVKQSEYRQIAKFSLLPSLVNLNQPLLIGLPVFFNPILLIPYMLAPLASMTIAWLFTVLKWLPAAVYDVPGTTPGFLLGFLGTNGNPMALFVSALCLAVSGLIYYPFVKALVDLEATHENNL